MVSPQFVSSPNLIRVIKSRRKGLAGHVARVGDRRDAYRDLVWRSDGKMPFGIPWCRREDNIRIDLQQVGRRKRGMG
jgi:hypothetical protein